MSAVDVIPAVAVPRPHRGVFSYRSPMPLAQGALVEVPFGRRTVYGIVVGATKHSRRRQLKPIGRVITTRPFFPAPLLDFLQWEAIAWVTPVGAILKKALPPWLRRYDPFDASLPQERSHPTMSVSHSPLVIGADTIRFRRYVELANRAVRSGKQVLILFPTTRGSDTFLRDFRSETIVAAPRGSHRKARELWLRIREGVPLAVVGTRHDLHLPFVHLRAIIIDDIANSLWKETHRRPALDGRIAAHALSSLWRIPLVRGSLLPPLEEAHRYRNPKLPGEVRIVDLRRDRPKRGVSDELRDLLRVFAEIPRGRALVFINRLGTAPAFVCRDCGYVFTCTACAAPLPVYRVAETKGRASERFASNPKEESGVLTTRLRCRHCGKEFIPSLVCPSCRGLRLAPYGIATGGFAEVLRDLLPAVSLSRLGSDVARRPASARAILAAFREHDGPALLLATAMVFHQTLPPLHCIAVPAFEQLLSLPEYDAEEKAFATMLTLRGLLAKHGTLMVQTWRADHPLLSEIARGDVRSFAKRECALRRKIGWPPYFRLVKLTYRHRDPQRAEAEAQRLFKTLNRAFRRFPASLRLEMLGPSPAFIARVRGVFVWRIIAKWRPKGVCDLRVEKVLGKTMPPAWDVDVNPASIL